LFSLDLVRAQINLLFLTGAVSVIASCAAPYRVGGIRTSGRIGDISTGDIEAAVAAYQGSIWHGPARIGEIEVISHDEVRMHDLPPPSSYTSMVRVKDKWVLGSVVLVHPIY
jgi:hypothetical protein